MTNSKPVVFLELDAGEQREFLAEELADWTDAGFWQTPRARTWNRRAKILARSVGMSHAELLDILRGDAETILGTQAEAVAQDAGTLR
jgi:hypothetical protein